jgi:hypothetical protein
VHICNFRFQSLLKRNVSTFVRLVARTVTIVSWELTPSGLIAIYRGYTGTLSSGKMVKPCKRNAVRMMGREPGPAH